MREAKVAEKLRERIGEIISAEASISLYEQAIPMADQILAEVRVALPEIEDTSISMANFKAGEHAYRAECLKILGKVV